NSTYWFNFDSRAAGSGAITVGEFNVINSEIQGFKRGILMFNNDNAADASITINKIVLDNCIYHSGAPYQGFGVIQVTKRYTDIWNDISITNSTFYNCTSTSGLFGATSANTFIQQRGKVRI